MLPDVTVLLIGMSGPLLLLQILRQYTLLVLHVLLLASVAVAVVLAVVVLAATVLE